MNLLKKHLNIIIILSLLAYTLLGILFLSNKDAELSLVIWIPFTLMVVLLPSNVVGDMVPNVSNVFFLAIILAPAFWAFWQKDRSKKWLLLTLVPVGWLILLLGTKRKT